MPESSPRRSSAISLGRAGALALVGRQLETLRLPVCWPVRSRQPPPPERGRASRGLRHVARDHLLDAAEGLVEDARALVPTAISPSTGTSPSSVFGISSEPMSVGSRPSEQDEERQREASPGRRGSVACRLRE
jgi:hypothetical protein